MSAQVEGPAPSAPPLVVGEVSPALPGFVSTVYSNEHVEGFRVLRPLGPVRGVTVRSRNIVASIGAGLKTLVGGEIKNWTVLCEDARAQAMMRMLEKAAEMGASGVVSVRFDTNELSQGITEVIAYGTAVSDSEASSGSNEQASSAQAGAATIQSAFVCNSNEIPGYTVHRSLGVVHGLTVRSRNIFANIGAGLKSLAGGEIKTLTKLCEDAREEAYSRMIAEAIARGADGIVAARYSTGEVINGVTELMAYGTAVCSTNSDVPSAPELAQLSAGTYLCNMVTTASSLPGFEVQSSLGVVRGITVRSANILKNIGASLKTIVGGEVKTWTKLCQAARAEAFERMLQNAEQLGAKGIIAMRYDTNQVSDGIVEVVAYGTAVSDVALALPSDASNGIAPCRVSTDLQCRFGDAAAERTLGVVRGISVQSCHLIRTIGAGLKTIVGGEIRNYSRMCENAREAAFDMMQQQGSQMGATDIIGFRYECNDLAPGVIEVVAYGTAISNLPAPESVAPAAAQGAPIIGTVGGIFVSTTNKIANTELKQSLGVVRGITVRSNNLIAGIGAGLKATFVGGEINTFRKMCDQSRSDAHSRMLEQAAELGARAIVAMRYETNELAPGVTEVLAYGTAVA